eukprot:Awhi_evm1s2964
MYDGVNVGGFTLLDGILTLESNSYISFQVEAFSDGPVSFELLGQGFDGSSNSFYTYVDPSVKLRVDIPMTPFASWKNGGTYSFTKGLNTIYVSHRESRTELKYLRISSGDAVFIPAPINIALGKNVIFKNIQSQYPASNLVDGNPYTFTHGDTSGITSIIIDLGDIHTISHVKLWNRVNCCQERNVGFQIQFIELRNGDPTVYSYEDYPEFTPDMLEYHIETTGTRARYVEYWIDASDIMNVGELEVFGKKVQ